MQYDNALPSRQTTHLLVSEHDCCLLVRCQLADDLSIDAAALCEVVDLECGLLAIDSAVVGEAELGGVALDVVRDGELQIVTSLQEKLAG